MKGAWILGAAVLVIAAFVVFQFVNLSGEPASGVPASKDAGAGPSPIENYKREVMREAMRGLRYDSGRVEVDLANARDLDRIGDVDAARERFERAEQLLRTNNNVIGALAEFTDAVITAPQMAELYVGLGRGLIFRKKGKEAEAAFRTALDLDPDLTVARLHLASYLYGTGRQPEAIEEWTAVLAADPDDAEAHARLATARYYEGGLEEAARHLAEADRLGATVAPQFRTLLDAATQGLSVSARPVAAMAGAPTVGPQVRADVAGGTEASNETSIATTVVDPDEIVAVWNDWRDSTSSEIIRMGVGVSLDGGSTWIDFHVRPPAPHQSTVEGDPMTAYDHRTGTLWVGAISFASNGGLFVAKKVPGSTTFEPSVQIGQLSFADKCWMAAGPRPGNPNETNVYIAYNEGVWRSTDMGASWNGPVSAGGGIGFLPRVAPNGDVFVCYWDFSDGHFVSKSTNGGLSFGASVRMATRLDVWDTQDGSRFPGRFRAPEFGSLAIDPNDGTMYHVYPDTTNIVGGNRNVDLYFQESTSGGSTWTTPVVLGFDRIFPGDQFFPWIEVDQNGTIHMVFYDSQNTPQNDDDPDGFFDAYYAYSEDGGVSWLSARLTPNPFNSINDGLDRGDSQFIGDYLGLAYGGNKVYPCYLSTQNGDSDIFVHSIETVVDPNSLSLTAPTPGTVGADNSITAGNAVPGEDVHFFAGKNPGTKEIVQCPGVPIDINNPKRLGKVTADGNGDATITFRVPPRAAGLNVLFQAGQVSQCTKSDVVEFQF